MCLGIPGKIIFAVGDNELRLGRVRFGGVEQEVSLAFVPEANVGDYVIVHVGYAISVLDPEAARRTLELLDEIESIELNSRRGTALEVRR